MSRNRNTSILKPTLTKVAFDVVEGTKIELLEEFHGWMSNDFFIFGSKRSENERFLTTPSFDGVAVKGINVYGDKNGWYILKRRGDIGNADLTEYIDFSFEDYTWEPYFERSWREKGRLKYFAYLIGLEGNKICAKKSRGCSFLEFTQIIKDKA